MWGHGDSPRGRGAAWLLLLPGQLVKSFLFGKMRNKNWKSGLSLQDLDLQERATVECALLQVGLVGRWPCCLPRAPRVGSFS